MKGLTASVLVASVAACAPSGGDTLFERLPPRVSGVDFVNDLPDEPAINIVNYLNYYNGGGVAIGDVVGDPLPDIYFTSNLGPDRLYRNMGGMRFEDVTESAGLGQEPNWTSGVTMADVNADGRLDIYVSAAAHLDEPGGNVLYVNNGDNTFADRTAEFGLEHVGLSTQAAFFDMEGDGDLDMFLLNHSTHEVRGASFNPQARTRHPEAGDRLFRNDGGRFVDVSEAAGIYGGAEGYGLGVVVSDLNTDGCPDIFVANDFHESDFLYYNNCDGTFTESIQEATRHTSHSSMGIDAADINNDLRPDIVVLDMLPEREDILQTSANIEDLDVITVKRQAGYHEQVARNTLQLNRGNGKFSDIGFLAGIHATDWSWAALLADFDNDGWKDLFVTNGIYRRPNDLDYISYVTDRAVQVTIEGGVTERALAPLLERMPQVPIPNYAFRNLGNLTFDNASVPWGLNDEDFSTGAAYGDLDGDGDLDLVVNNINAPAAVYRNTVRDSADANFLTVAFEGAPLNPRGVGARVVVVDGDRAQLGEQQASRGFQSAVSDHLHFGLSGAAMADSVRVHWPDGRVEVRTDVPANQVLRLAHGDAEETVSSAEDAAPWFAVTEPPGGELRHRENTYFDYTRDPFLPHQLSREGPGVAVGDVNGDGLDDVVIGGAKWQPARMLIQTPSGAFTVVTPPAFVTDSVSEDVDLHLFDADADGDLDLLAVSGGNEFWGNHEPLTHRLYLNNGRGTFRRSDGMPAVRSNGSVARTSDFDGDGDLDVFIGGRVVGREYGAPPSSVLLRNDGSGRFADVTADLAPGLRRVGMVTDAAWADINRDGALDLIVAGEWMPLTVFAQRDGRFEDVTAQAGLSSTSGWWRSLAAVDVDADGDMDLVGGNLGINSFLRATGDQPLELHIADVNRDGRTDRFLTAYRGGTAYPFALRDQVISAFPQLAAQWPTYAAYGAATLQTIFPAESFEDVTVLAAAEMRSVVAINDGAGAFRVDGLPMEAQFAPTNALLVTDFNGDGHIDVLVAGNDHGMPPIRGRYDASYGEVLMGDGGGSFTAVDPSVSGLYLTGEIRAAAVLTRADGTPLLVFGRNNDTPVFVEALRMR